MGFWTIYGYIVISLCAIWGIVLVFYLHNKSEMDSRFRESYIKLMRQKLEKNREREEEEKRCEAELEEERQKEEELKIWEEQLDKWEENLDKRETELKHRMFRQKYL